MLDAIKNRWTDTVREILKVDEVSAKKWWVYPNYNMAMTELGYNQFVAAGIFFYESTVSKPVKPTARIKLGLSKIPAPYYYPSDTKFYIADEGLAVYFTLIDKDIAMFALGFDA